MKIEVAKSAGFCFGVKRALEKAYDLSKKTDSDKKNIYTLGDIIHNEHVVDDLRGKGVEAISFDEAMNLSGATIIIRSHGVSKNIFESLKKRGHEIIDATCPYVSKIQKLVNEHSLRGDYIVICGKRDHAEVIGVCGWAENSGCTVIGSGQEAEDFRLEKNNKIFMVAQTTFNNHKYKEYVEILIKKGYDVEHVDTICTATKERQKEAADLSARVDAMIVIGGRNSSNSKELFSICSNKCNHTLFIQSREDLDMKTLISKETVGITAGASTPDNIIREVILECQR